MRKAKLLIPSLLLIAFALFSISYYYTVESKHIHTIQLDASDTGKVLWGVSHKNKLVVAWQSFYLKELIVQSNTLLSKGITLKVNNTKVDIPLGQLQLLPESNSNYQALQKLSGNTVGYMYLISNFNTTQSALPYFKQFDNWSGDAALVKQVLLHPMLILILLVVFFKKQIFQFTTQVRLKPFSEISLSPKAELFILYAVFLAGFSYIVANDIYYFNQDDNYVQFTPVLNQGLNHFYSSGIIPTYNPYQAAGIPTTELGTYSFFYPVTHVAYLISNYLLSDANHFINVFVLIHFSFGLYFMYALLKRLNIHFLTRLIASLSFIFCGFNLEAARSWYYVAPAIAFLPFFIHFIHKNVQQTLSRKHFVWIVIAVTFFIYSGNFQFFIYTVVISCIYYLVMSKISFWTSIKNITKVLFIPILLFLPQLLMTFYSIKDLPRPGGTGAGILGGFGGLVTPFFNAVSKPSNWGTEAYLSYSGFFYKTGFVFLLIAFVYLFYVIIANRKYVSSNSNAKYFMVFFGCTFLLSIGKGGILWLVQGYLPLFNKFNHPFKFLLFVQYFGILLGSVIFQQYCNNKKLIILSFFVSVISLMYNVHSTKDAFYVYGIKEKNNYGTLGYESVFNKSNDYRMMTFSVGRSSSAYFNTMLISNLPTQYQIPSVFVYEPLAVVPTDFYRYYNEYGVRYFIVSKLTTNNPMFINNYGEYEKLYGKNNFPKIFENDLVSIYENTHYEPIVQFYDKQDSAVKNVPVTIRNESNGVTVSSDLKEPISKIVLSYRAINGIKIYLNNRKVDYHKDEMDRIIIRTNEIPQKIELRYVPRPF